MNLKSAVDYVRSAISSDVDPKFFDDICSVLNKDLIDKVVADGVKESPPPRIDYQSAPEEFSMGMIVARPSGRGATSFKPRNLDLEIRRTIYFGLLAGLAPAGFAYAGSPFAPLAILLGVAYAGINASSGSLSYTDACVLAEAWSLASNKRMLEAGLISQHLVIAQKYNLPKCQNPNEVKEAIEKLIAIKAIKRDTPAIILQERVLIAQNGTLRFAR